MRPSSFKYINEESPTFPSSLRRCRNKFTGSHSMLLSRRSNRGSLLLWSHRSLSGNHICSLPPCLKFLLSTSHPRWPHCSDSKSTFAHGLLLSNRINIHMSAAPISPASALSSLSLSTSSLSRDVVFLCSCGPCDRCSAPLRRCRRRCSSLVPYSPNLAPRSTH